MIKMLLDKVRTAVKQLARAVHPTSMNSGDSPQSQRDITRQQKLLVMHRSLLAEYLVQEQQWERIDVPDFLRFGMRAQRRRIAAVKGTLRVWGVDVNTLPDDEGSNDDDDIVGNIQHQRELLKICRRNLATYLRQQAQLPAGQTSAMLIYALDNTRSNIQRIKAILRGFGVAVDDLPGEAVE